MERELQNLGYLFRRNTNHLGRNNVDGTTLHKIQVDWVYLLNELKYNFSKENKLKCRNYLNGLQNKSIS